MFGRVGEFECWRLGERWPVSDVCCAALRCCDDLEVQNEVLLAERDGECREPWRLDDDDDDDMEGDVVVEDKKL